VGCVADGCVTPGPWDWPPLLPAGPGAVGAPGAGSQPVELPMEGAGEPFEPDGMGFGYVPSGAGGP
jgi:hypothetical protein